MALAIDSTSSKTDNTTSCTLAHTCSGSDRVLYVLVAERFDSTITGITYNGVGMTLVDQQLNSNRISVTIYRLIAPATGANNIVVTLSGAHRIVVTGISLTGAHQITPEGTAAKTTGNSTTPSIPVTSAAGEIVLDCVAVQDDTNVRTISIGAGQTEVSNLVLSNGTTNGVRGGTSYEAGAASTTMSWTIDLTAHWTIVGVPVKPSAGGVTPKGMSLLGAG